MIQAVMLYSLPYVAIAVGFTLLRSAWWATLLYHGVILLMWACRRPSLRWETRSRPALRWGVVLVCALTGPLIVGVWPWLVLPDVVLVDAMKSYGLSGGRWWAFAAYIAVVHPVLEEVYWRGLAPDCVATDVAFGGFHVILVAPFVGPGWVAVVVAILVCAGWVWRETVRQTGGLATACLSHAVADLGIMLALLYVR